ncbi:inositolphosphorylceramide synthase [Coprinellus micaceus]|uniref:Inositolphosphorylceramide synthase n=1 Tax=Coprinellus micaceus TaxID=71717 RepID=A0A4Y7SX39_COPMI|nr:inositolphosphorylceramide synthase [Coprinellus micaceus]
MPPPPKNRNCFSTIGQAFLAALARLDTSLSPSHTLTKLRSHKFVLSDTIYVFHLLLATYFFTIMSSPPFPFKLFIPVLWVVALIVPATSQFFVPATPIFMYLLSFYSSRFVPASVRPAVSVSLLPTLESVLYGANISDILTRFTHPLLDLVAWVPYGVGHFTLPFAIALFVWLFRSKEVLWFWARVFGYMNMTGVIIQIVFPCAPPWYEVIHGLTPADYGMKGSPGGLARIDALLHMSTYTQAFSNSPMVFGAFPSLHAGSATMEALFLAHFFPQLSRWVWVYAGVLYWATMYLTHHYLIDVVGGACMSTLFFYLSLPDELKSVQAATAPPSNLSAFVTGYQRTKYEEYDLEDPRRAGGPQSARAMMMDAVEYEVESEDEEVDITYRSPAPGSGVQGSFAQQQQQSGSKPITGQGQGGGRGHKHTASIASLIRSEERGPEDGWSPVRGAFREGLGSGRV